MSVLIVMDIHSIFQAPFNNVTLRAIGDDLATSYFDIAASGAVVTRQDLRVDTSTAYRVGTSHNNNNM